MSEPNYIDYLHALAQTREGRKDLTFAMRYGSSGNEEADEEIRRRAWEWVDDPTKPL